MLYSEHNSIARNLSRANDRLSPLKNSNNEIVPEFPETLRELHDLNGMHIYTVLDIEFNWDTLDPQIDHLLLAFNLPINGDLPDRRRRFQSFIGVGYDV